MAEKDRMDEVLDAVKAMCDSTMTAVNKRCDAMASEFKDRLDRMDAEHEKEKKDRLDAEKAESERKDAEAAKERADAAAAAAAEQVRADAAAAQARADAAAASSSETAARLAEIEKRIPAQLTQAEKSIFASAQIRADSAYNAWGKQAPPALNGETPRDYRIRLLKEIQGHSPAFKDSDLSTVADETAFSMIEGVIIADAVKASTSNIEVGAPLREVTTRDPSGHTITKFYGDPESCWSQFSGGTRFGRFVQPQNRH